MYIYRYGGSTGPTLLEAMDQFVKHMMEDEPRNPLPWCLEHYDNVPYTFEEFQWQVNIFYGTPTRIEYFVNKF